MKISSFQSIFTFRMYCDVARAVPLKAGTFSEPITVATGIFGKKARASGVCISPPPPTTASIKPAAKAARQR